MAHSGDEQVFAPEHFSGRVRLFPLPNLVMFPHVIQPLHVFEPRYVDLLHDALSGDRLIAMSLLEPGWEPDYDGRPPIAPIACLGQVLTWQAQAGSRYNLLLLGVHRVRILRELPAEKSYREAEVELVADEYSPGVAHSRPELQRRLIEAFEGLLPRIQDAEEIFNQLSVNSISLGTLTDVISYALELDVREKQMLLAERNVDSRCQMLLSHLGRAARDVCHHPLGGDFPPSFSSN